MALSIDQSVRRLRQRAMLASLVGVGSVHLLVALLLAGSAALLLRLLLGLPPDRAALVLFVVALVPLTAWLVARRRFLSPEGAAAWLDVRSGATGILVTELELADARWEGRANEALARAPRLPAIRMRPAAARSFLGIAFALLALWVDIPKNVMGPPPALFESSLETLREQLETLEEEVALDEATAEELEARMDRLESEATDSENPEATFEALDQLSDRLETEALEAQESALAAAAELEEAASLVDENPADAEVKFAETLAMLAEDGLLQNLPSALTQELGANGAELPEGLELDPAMLAKLSQELAKALEGKLGKLAQAGLLKFGKPGQLGELGELSAFNFTEHVCDESCEKAGGT